MGKGLLFWSEGNALELDRGAGCITQHCKCAQCH